jgi:hypothetical protein
VTNSPRDIKAFYIKQQSPGQLTGREGEAALGLTVECFDLLVPDLYEIAGGSIREHRLPTLLEAIRLHSIVTPSAHPLVPIAAMRAQTNFVLGCTAAGWGYFSIKQCSLRINTGKAGKDFTFSPDDTRGIQTADLPFSR